MWVVTEKDGSEGIPAQIIEGIFMPLLGADTDRAKATEGPAKAIAMSKRLPIKLLHFRNPETLEAHDYSEGKVKQRVSDGWTKVSDLPPEPGKAVFVFYKNSHGEGRQIKAYYLPKCHSVFDGDHDFHEPDYHEDKDEYFFCEGWYEVIDNWDQFSSIMVTEGEVTHYRPLFAEPKD